MASAEPGRTDDAPRAEFQQVTLAKGVPEMGEPMSLAVLPDRWVLHTSPDGTLRVTDPTAASEGAPRPPSAGPRPARRPVNGHQRAPAPADRTAG